MEVKSDIPCKLIKSPSDLEVVCVILNLSHPITYCVIYIPPNSSASYCDKLLNFLSDICSTSERLIILGDFNLPDIQWDLLTGNTPASEKLCELVFRTGLFQLINEPTHIQGNILDLLLTNIDDSFNSLEVHPTPLLSSDHFYITVSVAVNCNFFSKSSTYYSFNYSRGDYTGLSNYLMHTYFISCYLTHDVGKLLKIIL